MKQFRPYAWLIIIVYSLINPGCQQIPDRIHTKYTFIKPTYDSIQLLMENDTLHFLLDDHSYNEIRTFNYFTHKGKGFIAFLDKNTRSLNSYDFASQKLVQKLSLKQRIPKEHFTKAATFVVNFDSIYVISDESVVLLDSAGSIKNKFELFKSKSAKSIIDNETPVFVKNNILFTGVMPFLSETSLKDQQNWGIVAGYDLENNSKQLYYHLSSIYQKDLYGYSFLKYSYCINHRGNFVFSFPADTCIYETNLVDYNHAYDAKSQFQTGTIMPVARKILEKGDSRKEYYLRDGYGTIYFDPHQKRYLRFAKQKISEADIIANKKERKRSVIVLDKNFKVIGESGIPDSMAFKSMFFVPEGGIYVRVKTEDEHALHFARLDYSDKQTTEKHLTQHNPELK